MFKFSAFHCIYRKDKEVTRTYKIHNQNGYQSSQKLGDTSMNSSNCQSWVKENSQWSTYALLQEMGQIVPPKRRQKNHFISRPLSLRLRGCKPLLYFTSIAIGGRQSTFSFNPCPIPFPLLNTSKCTYSIILVPRKHLGIPDNIRWNKNQGQLAMVYCIIGNAILICKIRSSSTKNINYQLCLLDLVALNSCMLVCLFNMLQRINISQRRSHLTISWTGCVLVQVL